MNREIITYLVLPVVVFGTMIYSLSTPETLDFCDYYVEGIESEYSVAPLDLTKTEIVLNSDLKECISTPFLDKSFVGFKEALGFKESRGDYFAVNTLGYLGKYQFGKNTLKLIGIHNPKDFLSSPKLQEQAIIANTARNKWVLRRDINRFVGKRIDGVLVTESGILAAAHLAGPGSVKKYLRSYGAIGFTDAYGTSVRYYMKKFSGYDMSFIVANKKAKAKLL